MDPNTNPVPPQPRAIQDVLPPHDSLGNPENLDPAEPIPQPASHLNRSRPPLPSHNPIAGTALAQSQATHDGPVDDHALDSVLKDVTSNIKATAPGPSQAKPAKKGFFGFFKKKPKLAPPLRPHSPHSPTHLPNPHQTQQSHSQQTLPPASPNAHRPASQPLKSGPVQPKKKGKLSAPAVVAVIVALVLIFVAFSAFKQ
jgi:hypothetical protein